MKIILLLISGSLLFGRLNAFYAPKFRMTSKSNFAPAVDYTRAYYDSTSLQMALGGHNQNFRFIPTTKLDREEFWPQILPIAGVYGEMTEEDLAAPAPAMFPEQGYWSYEFAHADMPQLGTVAFPGSQTLAECNDPVVVIATNTQLQISLSEEVEVMMVVDRSATTWKNDEHFYLFKTPEGGMVVMWSDEGCPSGYTILGRVAIVSVPLTDAMRGKNTMFEEE